MQSANLDIGLVLIRSMVFPLLMVGLCIVYGTYIETSGWVLIGKACGYAIGAFCIMVGLQLGLSAFSLERLKNMRKPF